MRNGDEGTDSPEKTTLEDLAYGRIRAAILAGKLPPGTRLAEPTLAKKINISRTPVRGALRRLASEGLVTISANHGATVTVPSLRDIENAYRFEKPRCLAALRCGGEGVAGGHGTASRGRAGGATLSRPGRSGGVHPDQREDSSPCGLPLGQPSSGAGGRVRHEPHQRVPVPPGSVLRTGGFGSPPDLGTCHHHRCPGGRRQPLGGGGHAGAHPLLPG
jgi:hypothetical protein